MPFDPDAFLAEPPVKRFDPDAFLAEKPSFDPDAFLAEPVAAPKPESDSGRIRHLVESGKMSQDEGMRQIEASKEQSPEQTAIDRIGHASYETAKGVATTAAGLALAPVGAALGAVGGTAVAGPVGTFVGGAAGGMAGFSAGSAVADKLISLGENELAKHSDTFAAGLQETQNDPYAKAIGETVPAASLAIESGGGYLATNAAKNVGAVIQKAIAGAAGMVIGEQAVTGATQQRLMTGDELLHAVGSGIMFGGGKASEVQETAKTARTTGLTETAAAIRETTGVNGQISEADLLPAPRDKPIVPPPTGNFAEMERRVPETTQPANSISPETPVPAPFTPEQKAAQEIGATGNQLPNAETSVPALATPETPVDPAKANIIETDPARRQEIQNSIQEGEGILKTGKTIQGKKMTLPQLEGVRLSVDNAKSKLGITNAETRPPNEPRTETPVGNPEIAKALETLPDQQRGGEGAPEVVAGVKKPWEQTLGEALGKSDSEVDWKNNKDPLTPEGQSHRKAVEQAVAEGKPVPQNVLKDYPWIEAGRNIQPYVESLRGMSNKELKAEEKLASAELNKWASKTPALFPDGTVNPLLGKVSSHEVSAKFNAVNSEIDARNGNKPVTKAEQSPVATTETANTFSKEGQAAPSSNPEPAPQIQGSEPSISIPSQLNVIRYADKTKAISDAEGNIYATIRESKRKSGQPFYEVKGYSKLAGKHSDLEGIYEARGEQSAILAARKIAEREVAPAEQNAAEAKAIADKAQGGLFEEPKTHISEVFGQDEAKFRDLLSQENSNDPVIADAATVEREKMESNLAPKKLAALYKMKLRDGESGHTTLVGDVFDAIHSAGKVIAKKTSDFIDWSKEMVTRFGEAITPHLKNVWKAINTGGIAYRPGKSETGSIINPFKKFVEDDVKPFAVDGARNTVTAMRQIKSFVAPTSMGDQAAETAGIVRQNAAELARQHEVARESLKTAAKIFDKNDNVTNLQFIHDMETGKSMPTSDLQRFADTMRSAMDDRLAQVRALGTGKLQNAIANYFPHIWKDPEAAGSWYGQVFGRKPLEGPKSFLKQRSLPTTADGIAAGLEPVSHNPVELALLKLHEVDRYVMGQKIMAEMKDRGIANFVGSQQKAPEGFVKINDRVAEVMQMRPTIKADGSIGSPEMIIRGHFYAPEDAARIINNYLSPGLRGIKVYDGFRWLGNALNQAQLGFSAFHLGMVSIDSGVSKVALGIENIFSGHPLQGLRNIAQSPVAPVLNMIRGNKMLEEYYKPGSVGGDIGHYMDAAMKAGGRATMDSFYQTDAWKGFTKALKSGNIPGAALRLPFAAFHLAAKPILEYAVPRMKMGMFADFARTELERIGPTATLQEQRAVMAKAWDSVDNRMGQMIYDNLFWNKALKDSLMAGTRSVGWNLGTIRELGGGVVDALSTPARAIRSSKGTSRLGEKVFTHRMAYAMALPMVVGTLGAVYQKLHTGLLPGQNDDGTFGNAGLVLKDLFLPRTGKRNAQGEPERVLMPSYMKDVFAYAKHPLTTLANKASPAISMVGQMLDNKDYYGTEITDSNDSFFQKAKDEVAFVTKQLTPFSIQGAKHRAGSGTVEKVESAVGINPAPAELTRTPAHQAMMDAIMARMPAGTRTKDQQAKADLRKSIIDAGRKGESVSDAIQKADKTGVSFTYRQKQNIKSAAKKDPRAVLFNYLSREEAQNVFDLANPEEKKLYGPLLSLKKSR